MRKLHLQMQMSVDGFVSSGPADEQQWITLVWEEVRSYVTGLLDATDTILIGRKLAIDYIPHWERVAQQPDNPFHGVAERICRARKVVFTRTLKRSAWDNTVLATGDLVAEVEALKARDGKDIVVYGGSTLVAALIQAGLIDEFHLFLNPIALGRGDSVFSTREDWQRLRLRQSVAYGCGLVLLNYVKD